MIEIKFKGKTKNVFQSETDGQWIEGFYRYQPYHNIHTICFFKEKELLINGIGHGGEYWRVLESIGEY